MRSALYLFAGLIVGTLIATILLSLPGWWAAGVGVIGGLALWYVVWGRRDLALALRKRGGH